ncbi:MAG: hypothetical protein AMXMBFR7_20580 [Planctomycetota bacterium]
MGYNIYWLGVRGKANDVVLSELGFCGTGKFEESPEGKYSAVLLSTGWYVIFANETGYYPSLSDLNQLSQNAEVLLCQIMEGSMYSEASHWRLGTMVWNVTHDSSRGLKHLHVRGEPPAAYHKIRESLLQKQDMDTSTYQGMGVDYIFDVPIELARAITGFRHDEDILYLDEDIVEPFELLEAVAPPAKRRGFFQWLFRR